MLTGTDSGIAHIIFGNQNEFSNFDFASPGARALRIFGASGSNMGITVNIAKDLNKDGARDILTLGAVNAYVLNEDICRFHSM